MAKNEHTINVLSYRRALEISDASMVERYRDGEGGEGEVPVEPYLHGQRPAKGFEQATEKSGNLTYGEKARLSESALGLQARMTVTPLPVQSMPFACESGEAMKTMTRIGESLVESEEGRSRLMAIAHLYAYNLLSGWWTWRNREKATRVHTTVTFNAEETEDPKRVSRIEVDATSLLGSADLPGSLKNRLFDGKTPVEALDPETQKAVRLVATGLYEGWTGQSRHTLTVACDLDIPGGQEVFPSQVYDPQEHKVGSQPVGKTYFRTRTRPEGLPSIKETAGLTAEKVNAALRCFDADYPEADAMGRAITIGATGGDLRTQSPMRPASSKRSFQALRKKAQANLAKGAEGEAILDGITESDRQFMVACLIMGGVFGDASEKEQ